MGSITVQDLAHFAPAHIEIIVADYDLAKAGALVATLMAAPRNPKLPPRAKLRALKVDLRKAHECAEALSGAFAIINCTQYSWNLAVMELALRIGAHYLDLGGLFHTTKKQLELDQAFRDKKLLAVLGIGAAPGITNLLARHGADALDSVSEIHVRLAGFDGTMYKNIPALPVAYSLQTILEEFSYKPALFTKGQMTFVEPMSGDTELRFPSPIVKARPMYTIHSEVLTLPESFKIKGVKEVSFKIAFDPDFVTKVRFLRDLGMASHEEISLGGLQVRPIEVINKVAMSQLPATRVGKLKQFEILRVVVKGKKSKKPLTKVVDCHTFGMHEWNLGTDTNTGCPPSIAALMLADGTLKGVGVQAPENVFDTQSFFKELAKRNMKIKVKTVSGLKFAT